MSRMYQEEFVNPNWHVAVVHFPIALLLIGTIIELGSFLYRRSSLRVAGRWMILLGALGMVPVATSGLYALVDVVQMGNENAGMSWAEQRQGSPVRGTGWAMIERHAWTMGIITVAGLVVTIGYLASSDRVRQKLYPIFLLGLLGVSGAIVYGAWFAGEASYMEKVGVYDKETMGEKEKVKGYAFFVSPIQVHMLLAGAVTSMAALSFGLATRRITGVRAIEVESTHERSDPINMLSALSPETKFAVIDVPPAGRFWLLTFAVFVVASLSGWWYLTMDSGAWISSGKNPKKTAQLLWEQVKPIPGQPISRRFAHVVGAGLIGVSTILLAIFARFGPRNRFMLLVLSLLLFVVLSAQAWIGSLMLMDGTDGTIAKFNPPATQVSGTRD